MAAMPTPMMKEETGLYVVHPLDDVREEKCSSEGLGLIELTPAVRYSLMALRVYLLAMTAVIVYRALGLVHWLGHGR